MTLPFDRHAGHRTRAQASDQGCRSGFELKLLALVIAIEALGSTWRASVAAPLQEAPRYAAFNPDFLGNGARETVDLARFERGNHLPSGTYRLDIYVNQRWTGRQPLRLLEDEKAPQGVRYCFRADQLGALGIDLDKLSDPDAARRLIESSECIELSQLVSESRVEVQLSELTAHVSIPQAYLGREARGQVDPRDWDSGVTAAFIGYNTSLYRNRTDGRDSEQLSIGLNNGVNLGEWRLRSNGYYNRSRQDGAPSRSHYSNASTYAQRDLTGLRSQLTVGDYYTPGDLFDSVPFRGVQVGSDDRMLPESLRGFAPVIHGTAETNAKVTVRQGSAVLYETTVAPGPFAIDDLYDSGYSGDLEVTVTEADGRERSFQVPYASVAQLLRPGTTRFNFTAGEYRSKGMDRVPKFVMGTYQRGLSNELSAYTGSLVAEKYMAVQGGVALSTRLGAVALDVTGSRLSESPVEGDKAPRSGQSYRVTYSKLLDATQTNFTVAAYRFSSEGYLGFSEYAQAYGSPGSTLYRQRSRFQVSANQPLGGERGNLYITGTAQNYWNSGQRSDMTFQAGYSNGFRWGSMGLSVGRTRTNGGFENQYMVNLSIPLGSSPRAPSLSTSVNYASGRSNTQASLSGSLGEQYETSYSVYGAQNRDHGERTSNAGGNIYHRASAAALSAGISKGTGYRQENLGVSGSLVVHPGGINFTQAQSDSFAVIEAKGAQGAHVSNDNGVRIARNGYAVIGGLAPYRRSQVVLDPKGMFRNVELQLTEQSVTPRHGAVVMLRYPTITGVPVLLRILREDGQMPPLGSEVVDGQGNSLTMVGQGGRAFLRGLEPAGWLDVRWGDGPDKRCRFQYQLPEQDADDPNYQQLDVRCIAPAGRSELALAG